MLDATLEILSREFAKAAWESTIMLGISTVLGVIFGLICGLVLYPVSYTHLTLPTT